MVGWGVGLRCGCSACEAGVEWLEVGAMLADLDSQTITVPSWLMCGNVSSQSLSNVCEMRCVVSVGMWWMNSSRSDLGELTEVLP